MEIEQKYMVCTSCMTYNQSQYIVDTMNGFSMQDTTFPVINLILDDASTDGAPDVILCYLTDYFETPYCDRETEDYRLICAKHKKNPNCTFVVFFLKYNHYSIKKTKIPYQAEWINNAKYIAFCEGDDYWNAPLKLQKQVDFMETHPEYDMVTTASMIYEQGVGMKKGTYGHEYRGIQDLLAGNYIYYASILQRKSLEDRYIQEVGYHADWKMGDWPRILHCAIVSKIGYIDEPMTVYRVLLNSASHFDCFEKFKEFNENSVQVAKFLIDRYNLKGDELYSILDNWLNRRLLMKACSLGDWEIVRQYRHKVRDLSAKERFLVVLLSNPFSNSIYKIYKTVRFSFRRRAK